MKEQKNTKNNIWRIIILILCVVICAMVLAFFVSQKNQEVNNKIESGEINKGNTTSGEINKNEENNIQIESGEIDIAAVKQEDGSVTVDIRPPTGLKEEEKEKIINNKFNKTEFMVTTTNEKPSIDDANWKEYMPREKYTSLQVSAETKNIYVWYKNGDEINSISNDGIMLLAAEDNYEANGAYYSTLEEAYSNLPSSGGTITVMKDNEDSSNLRIQYRKNLILDMNGKTINKTTSIIINSGSNYSEGGELQIKGNGKIKSSIDKLIDNGGKLTIEDGTIETTGNTAIYIYKSPNVRYTNKLTINGGTIKAKGTAETAAVEIYVTTATSIPSYPAEFYMSGGSIESENGIGLSISGYANGEMSISDKVISDEIYLPMIKGGTYGLVSNVINNNKGPSGSFKFYTGAIAGKTEAVNGTKRNKRRLA